MRTNEEAVSGCIRVAFLAWSESSIRALPKERYDCGRHIESLGTKFQRLNRWGWREEIFSCFAYPSYPRLSGEELKI